MFVSVRLNGCIRCVRQLKFKHTFESASQRSEFEYQTKQNSRCIFAMQSGTLRLEFSIKVKFQEQIHSIYLSDFYSYSCCDFISIYCNCLYLKCDELKTMDLNLFCLLSEILWCYDVACEFHASILCFFPLRLLAFLRVFLFFFIGYLLNVDFSFERKEHFCLCSSKINSFSVILTSPLLSLQKKLII